ncbi:MAG: shikimate dehydrogenase [Chlorobi bacterium]|nr:shikimate dehydrogenase [Chlorobiota bacterium]
MGELYGLVGKQIDYSRSPELFGEFFRLSGTDARYELFDLQDISELTRILTLPDLKGFNVTIPYKRAVIPFLDRLDESARALGVVNTVKIEKDGTRTGYNTDIHGFMHLWKLVVPTGTGPALILGNGATARTVRHVLDNLGIAHRTVSRHPAPGMLSYDELTPEILRQYPVIVHTTPLGNANHPGQKPALPYEGLDAGHYLIDLNYAPPVTPFLEEGLRRGAVAANGWAMLKAQARRAFEIWTGRK